jgi:hypothetical protein
MRALWIVLTTIDLAVLVPAAAQAPLEQKPRSDAAGILAAARDALGGDQKLSGIRTVVARGRTLQVRGSNLVPIEFEILCELPDKYVRRDEIPAQESGLTSVGFNGDALIQVPPPAGPQAASSVAKPAPPASSPAKPAAPLPDPRLARVTSIKQDFVRLTLGMFAASFSSYPLTFSFAGQAEAPQGKADILDVKGAGTFALRLFINTDTHLPIMVSWTTPATNVVLWIPARRPTSTSSRPTFASIPGGSPRRSSGELPCRVPSPLVPSPSYCSWPRSILRPRRSHRARLA